jgi:hypothetical protein
MNGWLPVWKKEMDILWLKESPAQLLQSALKDLDRSYKNFFEKRAAYPKFKKKSSNNSFRFPQGFHLDAVNSRIKFPKLGWIRYRKSREVEGTVKNITVSYVAGKWYASIQTEREVEQPVHPSTSTIGLDAGIPIKIKKQAVQVSEDELTDEMIFKIIKKDIRAGELRVDYDLPEDEDDFDLKTGGIYVNTKDNFVILKTGFNNETKKFWKISDKTPIFCKLTDEDKMLMVLMENLS